MLTQLACECRGRRGPRVVGPLALHNTIVSDDKKLVYGNFIWQSSSGTFRSTSQSFTPISVARHSVVYVEIGSGQEGFGLVYDETTDRLQMYMLNFARFNRALADGKLKGEILTLAREGDKGVLIHNDAKLLAFLKSSEGQILEATPLRTFQRIQPVKSDSTKHNHRLAPANVE